NSASYSPNRSQDDGPNSCADARTFERPCLGRDGHSQQGQRDNPSLNCSVHVGPLEFQRGSIKQCAQAPVILGRTNIELHLSVLGKFCERPYNSFVICACAANVLPSWERQVRDPCVSGGGHAHSQCLNTVLLITGGLSQP